MIVQCLVPPLAADSYEDMSAWVRKVCAACGLSAAQDDDDAAAASAGADENDQGRERVPRDRLAMKFMKGRTYLFPDRTS